jgi:hypothetical protein
MLTRISFCGLLYTFKWLDNGFELAGVVSTASLNSNVPDLSYRHYHSQVPLISELLKTLAILEVLSVIPKHATYPK